MVWNSSCGFQRVALWESDAALLPGKLQIKDLSIQDPRVVVHRHFDSPFRIAMSRHHAICAGNANPILSSYTTRLTCSQSATGLGRQSAGNCSCPPRRISSATKLGRYLRRSRHPFETCSTTSLSHLCFLRCFGAFVLGERCRIARPSLGRGVQIVDALDNTVSSCVCNLEINHTFSFQWVRWGIRLGNVDYAVNVEGNVLA